MTTLVTGAAGFAGLHLLDRLGASADLHGTWRPDSASPAPRAGVTWHPLELTDRQSVTDTIAAVRPDRLYHLAGAPSVETSWKNAVPHLEINVLGTSILLDAVRDSAPACRVLVVTSAQVYATRPTAIDEDAALVPESPYGVTKLGQDLLARAAAADGLDVRVARPFNHIGPRQTPGFAIARFARHIARAEAGLESPVIQVGNLDAARDFTDVRDVVGGYCRIVDDGVPGRPYNVCSGQAHRIGDLLDRLIALSKVPIHVEIDPARFRPVDSPVIVGDARRLRDELRWAPAIPIATTLEETLDWWRGEVTSGRDGGA